MLFFCIIKSTRGNKYKTIRSQGRNNNEEVWKNYGVICGCMYDVIPIYRMWCGKEKNGKAQKNEVYATIKKKDQSASAAEICSWLSYNVKNNGLFQNEMMELSYCSDNLAVLSDSVGSVIYDRTKKKIIAVVDLDKIGCDHFNSEGDEEDPGLKSFVKVSKDQKWMIVYNELQGKVNGKIYAYEWKDSKGIKKESVLVVDKDGLKLYTLSGKEKQPDIQSEKVNLKISEKATINAKLPEYEYTGKDARIKAAFDEVKKESDDEKEEGLITIPMLDIYKIVDTKSGAKVYANFWRETYYRYGSLLKNYSVGS